MDAATVRSWCGASGEAVPASTARCADAFPNGDAGTLLGGVYHRWMDYEVRPARPGDLPGLPTIENSGDGMFAGIGIAFPPGPTVIEEMGDDAEILVAGDPPVGFAAVRRVDGAAHLAQISVRDDLTGRGIGTRLLDAVTARAAGAGSPGVSLLTFRDVPWNAPWYAAHGFVELPEERWGPGIRSHWDAEIEAGLHELGPRLVMWAPVDGPRAN